VCGLGTGAREHTQALAVKQLLGGGVQIERKLQVKTNLQLRRNYD
jgi:hypothetical protein